MPTNRHTLSIAPERMRPLRTRAAAVREVAGRFLTESTSSIVAMVATRGALAASRARLRALDSHARFEEAETNT